MGISYFIITFLVIFSACMCFALIRTDKMNKKLKQKILFKNIPSDLMLKHGMFRIEKIKSECRFIELESNQVSREHELEYLRNKFCTELQQYMDTEVTKVSNNELITTFSIYIAIKNGN